MSDAIRVHRDRCRFFNGIQHACCDAGVRYDDVRGPVEPSRDGAGQVQRFPCIELSNGAPLPDTCPKRSFLTQEEHEAERAEQRDAVARLLGELAAGRCPACGKDIKPTRQVGKCIYGACGHRIGQTGSSA